MCIRDKFLISLGILSDDYDVIVGELATDHGLCETISVLEARVYFLSNLLLYFQLLGKIFD